MRVELVGVGAILYLVNVVLSIFFAIIIIDKLYISKKFTKEKDFHLYNDLFSWEIFYIFIAAANILKITSIFIISDANFSNLLLRIRILVLFFPFWNKIIHLEKVMDKITYKRHYFAGMIPLIIIVLLVILRVPNQILVYIFLGFSLIPYLSFIIFLRNNGISIKKTLKIFFGAVFIGIGCIFGSEIIGDLGFNEMLNLLVSLTAPFSLIIGTLLIFDSFRKEIFT